MNRSNVSRVNNSQGRILEDMIMGAARQYEQEGKRKTTLYKYLGSEYDF